jgi:hypothetical protein
MAKFLAAPARLAVFLGKFLLHKTLLQYPQGTLTLVTHFLRVVEAFLRIKLLCVPAESLLEILLPDVSRQILLMSSFAAAFNFQAHPIEFRQIVAERHFKVWL